MVKIEMYKAFDDKIFEKREDCVTYEQEMRYEKLKELGLKLDEYCEMCDDCKDCIFDKNCADVYGVIRRGIRKFESE